RRRESSRARVGRMARVQDRQEAQGQGRSRMLATEVPLEKWQLAFDTQVRAFFVGASAAAKYMTAGGRILALSYRPGGQTGGWQPWDMGSAKAALESTCRYFAVALARHGITVNAVSPGASDETTPIGQAPKEVQEAIKDWVHAGWTPMRRRVTVKG